jgi:hypothetical protein
MRFCKAIAIVGSLALLVAATYERSDSSYTCLGCRATQTKSRIFGIRSEKITTNSYSESVVAHDPSHQHQWRWCGSAHTASLFSEMHACGRQHPIWQLPVSIQERYSKLVSESELHDALKAIDSPSRETAESAVNRVYERVLDSQ